MDTASRFSGPPIVRQAHPLAIAAFLRHIGVPTDRLLRQQGLAVFSDDPSELVPMQRVWGFFDAAARTVDPAVGWHAGKYVGDHNLAAPLLRRLESEPTLYQALKVFARLASAEASHIDLGVLEQRRDVLFFSRYPTMKAVPGYPVSEGYRIAVFVELIRHFVGQRWVPKEIGIEGPEVPRTVEEMLPGCRILTLQRFAYIAVSRAALHIAVHETHPEAQDDDPLVLTKNLNFDEILGSLLHAYLPGGYPSARLAASLVDTSVTTLGRRLADCGTSYRSLVDRVRFNAAKEFLRDTDMQVTDVGMAVGFDDSSNFARMFRRIGGLSPREFRQAARG